MREWIKKTVKEIGGSNLIAEYYLDNEGRYGIRQGIRVEFPNFLNENLMKTKGEFLDEIMRYTANKFMKEQLTEGTKVFNEIKSYGFDELNEVQAVHIQNYDEDKSALIHIYARNMRDENWIDELELHESFQFEAVSRFGFTIIPGSMSDFTIHVSKGKPVLGTTKDFLGMHFGITFLFLVRYVENIWNILLKKKVPDDFEVYKTYIYQYSDEIKELKMKITKKIDEMTRTTPEVDSSTRTKVSIIEKLHSYGINSIHFIPQNLLMNICLEQGEPLDKTKKDVEYHLIRS